MDAARAWAAAVEVTWWLAAIEDRLSAAFRPAGWLPSELPKLGDEWGRMRWDHYRSIRRSDEDGRVMDGLLWLRHRHTHEVAMTGQGSLRPFFGEPGALFYLSSGYTWRPSTAVAHDADGDQQPQLRSLYDAYVAGRQLDDPLRSVLLWLGRLFEVMGWDFLVEGGTMDADPRSLPSAP
jgi:hypothetical protein